MICEEDARIVKGRIIDNQRIKHFLDLDFIKDQRQGNKILDIGCQDGYVCSQLYEFGWDPYGVDIIKESLELAQNKYPSINFQWANCEKSIPFEDNFFDIVWAGDVIEHIHFTDIFVNEVNRVLKKGGLFVLTTPMHNPIKLLLIAIHNFEEHFDPEFSHLRFYSVKSLKSVLERRGLILQSVQYLGRFRPIAKIIFAIARKENDNRVFSKYRF